MAVDEWLLCVSIWPLAVLHLICWSVQAQTNNRKFLLWRGLALFGALLGVLCPLLLVHVRWKQLGADIWQDWWANALASLTQLSLLVLQYLFWICGSWCLLQLPSGICGASKIAGWALVLGMVSGFLANVESRNCLASGFVALTELLRNGDSQGWWMVVGNQTQDLENLIVSNSTILKEGLDECDGVAREPICLQLCRQKDLFLPTWPLGHRSCSQLISWQIFGFADRRSPLLMPWNWLVALLYVLLGLLVSRCSQLRGSSSGSTLMLSEGTLEEASAAASPARPVWPDGDGFRARPGGPSEEAKNSCSRWLYKVLSASDWEAARKELGILLAFTALGPAVPVAAALALLAEGEAASGCLVLMCIFLPSFDDLLNVKLISAMWRCFDRSFAGPEVWRHQWRRGFFEGISTVLICTLTLYFTPQLKTSTLVAVQLCIASSLLFSIPDGCLAAWLLSRSVPSGGYDFYEIQRNIEQLSLRKYRRSLVLLFLVCLEMRFPTTAHQGWRIVWTILIQYTMYLEFIPEIRHFFGLQADSMLPKSSLERFFRDTLSPRRTSVEQSCSSLQRLGLLLLLLSMACHLYAHLSEAGELQMGLFLVCQICLICLQLLDCCLPPLGWEEPTDSCGFYEIDVDRVVTAQLAPESAELAVLPEGREVEVLEVEEVLEGSQSYVRGRVKEGWITLRRIPGTSNDIFAFRRLSALKSSQP